MDDDWSTLMETVNDSKPLDGVAQNKRAHVQLTAYDQ